MVHRPIASLSLSVCLMLSFAASAQPGPPRQALMPGPAILFDPAQLPTFHGKVAAYSLTPWGGVDGVILEDGSQVQIGRRQSTQLAALVRPGDTVTVHGVKALVGNLILGASIANDAGGQTLIGGRMRPESVVAQGRVKAQLYNDRDEVDGVLLDDGSQIRLHPRDAARVAAQLMPGQMVYARGFGRDSAIGKVVAARQLGTTEADAKELGPDMVGRDGRGGPGMRGGDPGMGPRGVRGGTDRGGMDSGGMDQPPGPDDRPR